MKYQRSKQLTEEARLANIAEEKRRGRKLPALTFPGKKAVKSKAELKRKFHPIKAVFKKEKDRREYVILRDQETLMVEPYQPIIDDINKSYIDQKNYENGLKEKGDKGQKNLYFSNVKACPRGIYYNFFEPQYARDYTAKGLILFDDGNRHHTNLQRRLQDQGGIRNPEGFLRIPEIDANGYYDGLRIVETKKGSFYAILEIKSKLPYACFKVAQADYDQAQLYLYACQFSERLKSKGIKVSYIVILYKDRAVMTDDVHFSWLAQPDLDRQMEIMNYMRFLKFKVVDKKTLVPHPYMQFEWACVYCLFRAHCWEGVEAPIVGDAKDEIKLLEKTAEREIVEGYTARLADLLIKEKELRAEKKTIEKICLDFYLKHKEVLDARLAITQSSTTVWQTRQMIEAVSEVQFSDFGFECSRCKKLLKSCKCHDRKEDLGHSLEILSRLMDPTATKIRSVINSDSLDAMKFEQFRTKKLTKPYFYLKGAGK